MFQHKRFVPVSLLLSLITGCSPTEIDPDREIGEAYVAPMNMPLYNELAARPKVVTTVKHGEKLTIVRKRRRFLKVRTANGSTGWTDSRLLLLQDGLDALKHLADLAAKAPSFGTAMAYDPLNVHIQANRQSPSFAQVHPNERVDVIAYELVERVPYAYPEIIPPPPKIEPRPKKKKEESRIPLPEPPDPPSLPPNWMELSGSAQLEQDEKSGTHAEQGKGRKGEPAQPEAPIKDAWTLIRMKDGRCGWALTRLLTMAIPDDVAQYSERQRITSYVALGHVEDAGEKKGIWLWTTLADTMSPYHFDGFRLFTYSVHRHRYETSYRERGVAGYLPIEAKPTSNGIGSSFSLLLDTENGLVRREFQFNGYRVQVTGEALAQRRKDEFLVAPSTAAGGESTDDSSLKDKLKGLLK